LRLKKGVEHQGAAFVIHKNRGRKPSHSLSDSDREKIIALKRSDKYQKANFLHYQELLQKHEKIYVSYPMVYRILTQAGITSPKQKRKRKDHHLRKRNPREGMMVQMDASPFAWFLDGVIYNLHGAIDDAAGKVLGLNMKKNRMPDWLF
ncbi:MAG: integrase, partial [Firmicutes bacterium]|nr:integrase [Bacillota bacterium]